MVFTRFAVQILHPCVYSRLFTPTLWVGFYPHKRTLLGTLRLRLCCRVNSPIRCADSGVLGTVACIGCTTRPKAGVRSFLNPCFTTCRVPRAHTDDRFALAFVWAYLWCWQLESHSLASALAVFLFDNPAVSLPFLSFAPTFLLCASAL